MESWHITVTCIAALATAILGNSFVKSLPWIEGALFILQTMGFVIVLIVLLVLGPKINTHATFTEFQDNAGWGNVGLSTLVGVLSPFIILSGADSTCHLAEGAFYDCFWNLRDVLTTAFHSRNTASLQESPAGHDRVDVVQLSGSIHHDRSDYGSLYRL